jgi:hypothetical protein
MDTSMYPIDPWTQSCETEKKGMHPTWPGTALAKQGNKLPETVQQMLLKFDMEKCHQTLPDSSYV